MRLHRRQPILRIVTRITKRWDLAFLLTGGVLVLSRLVVTVPSGTFGPPGNPVSDFAAIATGQAMASTSTTVSWLRDYADIAIILLVAAHTAHMIGQWDRLGALPAVLRHAKMLAPSLQRQEQFSAILARHDRRFNSPFLDLIAAGAGIAVGIQLAQLPQHGIYPTIGGQQPALDRFAAWWANPAFHPAAFAVLMINFCGYLYMTFRHALVGVLMLGLIWDAQRTAGRVGEKWFGYTSPYGDYNSALDEVRRALSDVLFSITVLVFAFAIGNIYVAIPDVLIAIVVVPYIVLNPLFLIAPIVHLGGRLRESRRGLIADAERELRLAAAAARRGASTRSKAASISGAPTPERLALRLDAATAAVARAHALPASIVDPRGLLKAAAVYVLPVLTFAWTMTQG